MGESWYWKPKGTGNLKLLYEPGNWGDLLKGLWLTEVIAWCKNHLGGAGLSYRDAFAGATAYPLTPRTARRVQTVRDTPFGTILAPFLAHEAWPGSPRIAEALLAGSGARISIFERDPDRFATHAEMGYETLPVDDGWDVPTLACDRDEPHRLLLMDPYDFLSEWDSRLGDLCTAAEEDSVLLYVFNRAAQGKVYMRQYRAFRNQLDDLRGDLPKLIGRVPVDPFLPDAHHEMVFLPGRMLRESEGASALMNTLEERTLGLTQGMRRLESIES